MSGYYGFDDARRAVIVQRHDTPTPWINYLSNGALHAFVSQAGGGTAWWRSPQVFRLTRYRQYNLPLDSPGFYVYLRRADGRFWSPTHRPCDAVPDQFTATHQPGRTTFDAAKDGLRAALRLFVAPDHDVLVWDLTLTNESHEAIDLDVFGYVELSQLNWVIESCYSCYVKHQLKTWFDSSTGAVYYLFHHTDHGRRYEVPLVYLASTEPVVGHDGDRDAFIGAYRTEANPLAVAEGRCRGSAIDCGEPCAALQHRLRLGPDQSRRMQFFLGVTPNAARDFDGAVAAAAAQMAAVRAPNATDAQWTKLVDGWEAHLERFQCEAPDADAARQINTWNPVQSVHTGRYSRSISFYAPGVRGVGFRDTCQDMLAIAYRDPAWATRELEYLLTQQFADGHAVHTSWPVEGERPATAHIHSDDHLWLPLLAYAIVAETGDLSLLDQPIAYLADDASGPGKMASMWEHLLAAIAFTESHLGRHGIPLTLRSDWNDIIGRYAERGKGESVFAAQQYVYALRLMIELSEARGGEDAARLQRLRSKQLAALEACAWRGEWWCRGFDDDGNPVGVEGDTFGKIYLNPQSWAVICESGSLQQRTAAMDIAGERLNTKVGLQILAPSFDTWPKVADPFSGYSPGCGENGSIFCHANTWAVIAEALLGRADRAWQYYRQLIPHVAAQTVGIDRYQGEPYAYASNIVGPDNSRFGWANVTQVTGTAAWMDVAATQYLLGVRPEVAGLRLAPCLPADWKTSRVTRLYRGCRLDIRIHQRGGERQLQVDGQTVEGNLLRPAMLKGKREATIELTI